MKHGHTTILTGDAREQLAALPAGHFHSCVTSPPYWGLRSYIDHSDEIGREPTLAQHLANLVDVFRGVKRVLRDDGTCWVNYGDVFDDGDLMLLPYRVAEALRADGWLVRSAIVWAKAISFCDTYSGSCMPESLNGWRWERCRKKAEIRDEYGRTEKYIDCPGCDKCNPNGGYVLRKSSWRPTSSYELVFLLAKASGYYCDADAVRESSPDSYRGQRRISTGHQESRPDGANRIAYGDRQDPAGRNLRSVWTIHSQPMRLRRDLDPETRKRVLDQLNKEGVL